MGLLSILMWNKVYYDLNNLTCLEFYILQYFTKKYVLIIFGKVKVLKYPAGLELMPAYWGVPYHLNLLIFHVFLLYMYHNLEVAMSNVIFLVFVLHPYLSERYGYFFTNFGICVFIPW